MCMPLMHSCGSFHTARTNTHRHTNSAQPYGQIMSIMRNTSGGTKSVRGEEEWEERRCDTEGEKKKKKKEEIAQTGKQRCE